MKCPICGKEVERLKKQTGTDELGEPIFTQYAVCRDCKKQWNLDKQRMKKEAAARQASASPKTNEEGETASAASNEETGSSSETIEMKAASSSIDTAATREVPIPEEHSQKDQKSPKTASPKNSSEQKTASDNASPKKTSEKKAAPDNASPKKTSEKKTAPDNASPKKASSEKAASDGKPQKKKAPAKKESSQEQRYANIPSAQVREKKEKAVKQAYEDMLSTDTSKRKKKKKQTQEKEEADSNKKSKKSRSREKAKQKEGPKARFRILRILLGLIAIGAFGRFILNGVTIGLDNIALANNSNSGTTYLVLALCMLVCGLLLFIMQKSPSIFAFILPMLFTTTGAVFSFLKRESEMDLFYGAILAAAFTGILLILGILSKILDKKKKEKTGD